MGKRKFLFSIKYKLMLIMFSILIVTTGVIAGLSIKLIEKDKIVYIYDLNSSVAKIFSRQVELSLTNKKNILENFLSTYLYSSKKRELEKTFMHDHPELLAFSIWRVHSNSGQASRIEMEKWLFNKYNFEQKWDNALLKFRIKRPMMLAGLKDEGAMLVNSTFNEEFSTYTIAFKSNKFTNIILMGDFTEALFKDLFSQTDIYEAYLVDMHGKLLAHPDTRALLEKKDLSNLGIVKRIIEDKSISGVMSYELANGKSMLGAYAIIPSWGAGIVIEVPREMAFLGARNLIRNLFNIIVIIAVLALILVIFFSRSISMPIIKLSAVTKEIAQGKFTTRIKTRTSDEIGLLASDFNAMISKLDELTRQLIQSTKMASIGAIARSIGHEFGNVMEGIIGHADLILMEENLVEAKKRAEVIIDGAEQASMIIRNLKGISKTEELVKQEAAVLSCVESAILLAEPEYKRRGLSIEKDFSEDFFAEIDERQITQVFLNMLINGSHAMKKGGLMKISVEGEEKYVKIAFKDNGSGISQDNIEKIFEPLFTTKGDKGTGIGLAVSKDIVEKHGGTICVESIEGEGTTFFIRLPHSSS